VAFNAFDLLRYFRINDPYRLLGLLLIFFLLSLPQFINMGGLTYPELKGFLIGEKISDGNALYTGIIDSTAPLAGWFDALISLLFGRSLLARYILAFVVIFLQAGFFGMILVEKKAFAENTYLPSLLFVLLFFFSFDNFLLTPELIGFGFVLLGLNKLIKEIEFREQRDQTILKLGLFISLSTLFIFSYIVYLLGAIVILVLFTRTPPRKFFLMIVGFLLPHLIIVSIYYLIGGVGDVWKYYYLPNLEFSSVHYISLKSMLWLGAVPILFLVISLVMLNREARLTKYQSQLVQAMFVWLVFSFLQVLYAKDLRPQSFITLIPGFSFFMAHYFLLIRRKKLAEISLWMLLLSVVSISYFARYNKLESVDYNALRVPKIKSEIMDKRILVLDHDIEIYKDNRSATPFVNWTLSKEIFESADYYENVVEVYRGIKEDQPDLIRDKDNLLKPFLARIPELKKMYVRKDIYYVKIPDVGSSKK
jgi:hypothetical protein